MSFVVRDTDVASAILRRRLPESMRASIEGKSLAITFVTVGELTSWTIRRGWGARRLADMAAWRRHVTRIPYDEAVAATWGWLDARAGTRPTAADQRHVDSRLLPGRGRASRHAQPQGL